LDQIAVPSDAEVFMVASYATELSVGNELRIEAGKRIVRIDEGAPTGHCAAGR
jgi:hypothetical protein